MNGLLCGIEGLVVGDHGVIVRRVADDEIFLAVLLGVGTGRAVDGQVLAAVEGHGMHHGHVGGNDRSFEAGSLESEHIQLHITAWADVAELQPGGVVEGLGGQEAIGLQHQAGDVAQGESTAADALERGGHHQDLLQLAGTHKGPIIHADQRVGQTQGRDAGRRKGFRPELRDGQSVDLIRDVGFPAFADPGVDAHFGAVGDIAEVISGVFWRIGHGPGADLLRHLLLQRGEFGIGVGAQVKDIGGIGCGGAQQQRQQEAEKLFHGDSPFSGDFASSIA